MKRLFTLTCYFLFYPQDILFIDHTFFVKIFSYNLYESSNTEKNDFYNR